MLLFFRTSFVGHLSGILVGLLYTTGPLKKIMKKCAGLNSCFFFFSHLFSYIYINAATRKMAKTQWTKV